MSNVVFTIAILPILENMGQRFPPERSPTGRAQRYPKFNNLTRHFADFGRILGNACL